MIYIFFSNNPSSGDINSSNLPRFILLLSKGNNKKIRFSVSDILICNLF